MPAMIVDAVIPALNEEATVGAVVAALQRDVVRTVVVADNGSTDGTAAAAARAGAVVVREPRRGYGAACLRALAALPPGGDVVLFLDADGSDDLSVLGALLAPLADGTADFVVGSRVLGGGAAALTLPQKIGNALAARWLRVRYGLPATDLGPFRAIRRAALDALAMRDQTYGWTVEMQIKAARAGLRYREVAVRALPRKGGRSKVSGTLRGVVGAAWKIVGMLVRHEFSARPTRTEKGAVR
jgi:glycosyltransferase involved in cell wall biosynthesis